MRQPRRKQVRDETFRLLLENDLKGWKVRFNPRLTRTLGRCIPSQKTIEYQPRYMEQNDWEQVRKTILHEVAHALAGAGAGHGWRWQQFAKGLGLEDPSAVNYDAKLTKKFTGRCPNFEKCGREIQADRRRNVSCGRCSPSGLYSPAFAIVWTRND